MGTATAQAIKDLTANLQDCKSERKEEIQRLRDRINKHENRNEKTKAGIYEKVTSMEYEIDAKIRQNVEEIKSMIKEDIIKPLSAYKKASIKVVIGVTGTAFMALLGFIWWLLNVTNVITNLQSLIGG